MKNNVITALFYLAGIIALSFGISLIITADLGAGPWDAFFVGLTHQFGLTVGSWTFIIGFLLILLNGALLRNIPDFSALITMFLVGIFIDTWLLIVLAGLSPDMLLVRVLLMIAGILICATGIASYLQSSFARNPIDQAMIVFHTLTGKSLAFSKTFIEITMLFAALALSGPIGVGTILVAFGIGPLIQLFYKPIRALHQGTKAKTA